MHGSGELLDLDLASEFHVFPWKSPRPLPELLSSAMTTQPLSVTGAKKQTTHDVICLLGSCCLHGLYMSTSVLVSSGFL